MPSADVAKRGLAPVLLTLDSGGRLGDAAIHDGPGGRLYPAGCAMLAVILSYPLVRGQVDHGLGPRCEIYWEGYICSLAAVWQSSSNHWVGSISASHTVREWGFRQCNG